MANLSHASLEEATRSVILPFPGVNLQNAVIKTAGLDSADGPEINVQLGFPVARIADQIEQIIARHVTDKTGHEVRVQVGSKVRAHAVQSNLTPLPGVANVIAVASGKGGVGKSTTAVNIALALAADGASVGMLDADIYGPSQPTMLGLSGQNPVSKDGKSFEPLEAHGLQVMSVGFLIDEDKPVVWRGPMVTQALNQLTFQTNWRDLDYLIVDMPPGTGDTQLTLTQKVPVAGVVIVTTPQDIALLDARRGLKMFEKVGVRVLGIVENMSTHRCTACGHEDALFGEGGGEQLAGESGRPLLGRLPLHARIRSEADAGIPSVAADPNSDVAASYFEIARYTAAALASAPRDHKGAFGKIAIE